jgi:hypothetical protein
MKELQEYKNLLQNNMKDEQVQKSLGQQCPKYL